MTNDLVPAKAAARMIGRSVRWLVTMRKAETGPPFYKIGGAFMYSKEDIEAWLQSCRRPK